MTRSDARKRAQPTPAAQPEVWLSEEEREAWREAAEWIVRSAAPGFVTVPLAKQILALLDEVSRLAAAVELIARLDKANDQAEIERLIEFARHGDDQERIKAAAHEAGRAAGAAEAREIAEDEAAADQAPDAHAAEREWMQAFLAEHRMNAVTESLGPLGWSTRVKCDGETCDFYADGPRYWDVVREHDAHLVNGLLAAGVRGPEAVARIEGERDESRRMTMETASDNGTLIDALADAEADLAEALAALEAGDACGAVGCRAIGERDEALADCDSIVKAHLKIHAKDAADLADARARLAAVERLPLTTLGGFDYVYADDLEDALTDAAGHLSRTQGSDRGTETLPDALGREKGGNE